MHVPISIYNGKVYSLSSKLFLALKLIYFVLSARRNSVFRVPNTLHSCYDPPSNGAVLVWFSSHRKGKLTLLMHT